jgi:hypothetical protein
MSEEKFCGCGKLLPPQKWAKHGGGRPRKQCSPQCTHKATGVRFYGLTLHEYHEMLGKQDYSCAICGAHVNDEFRLLAVDHEHVDGFEKMKSEERKKFVRGLLCILCNKHRMAGINLQIAKRMVEYLEEYESRKDLSDGRTT